MDTALLTFDIEGLHHGRLVRPFDALQWMQALDVKLGQLSAQNGELPSCFSAKQMGDVLAAALHALLLLPISHDARHAIVDHVLVHAPGGFDECVIKALKKLRRIERAGHEPVVVVLVDMGGKADFLDKVEHFGTSKVWQSITPFVSFAEGHLQDLAAFERGLRAEVELHGLPAVSKVEMAAERGRFLPIAAFQDELSKDARAHAPQQTDATVQSDHADAVQPRPAPIFGLRLRFHEPVGGPIALGQWARYGMGQFLPG
jgi:CRISPR-associated protein Csb2